MEVASVTSPHLLLVQLIIWTPLDASVGNVVPRAGSPTLDRSSRNLGCHLPILDTLSRSKDHILLHKHPVKAQEMVVFATISFSFHHPTDGLWKKINAFPLRSPPRLFVHLRSSLNVTFVKPSSLFP